MEKSEFLEKAKEVAGWRKKGYYNGEKDVNFCVNLSDRNVAVIVRQSYDKERGSLMYDWLSVQLVWENTKGICHEILSQSWENYPKTIISVTLTEEGDNVKILVEHDEVPLDVKRIGQPSIHGYKVPNWHLLKKEVK